MTLSSWLTITTICILGAMSPGPSLAVVIKNTLSGGRKNGIKTAIGHGLGIGIYAFISMSSLAIIITASTLLFNTLQVAGALFLLWLGIKSLGIIKSAQTEGGHSAVTESVNQGFRNGFFIAFFNPKVALFFIALFSQFISADSLLSEKFIYAFTAAAIDTFWYLLIASLFSNSRLLNSLKQMSIWLDRVFGVLLISLGLRLLWEVLSHGEI
ncbi:LysE family translocator [Gynuella sunshinyii]|uniref:Putative threonine efflux protein n=1 Tax=Gynuella sunshinyii YC6258 TaxID=1445510 RepID=A0A0C5VVZ9_9GAMM|nr:LysE family translocator [Gynuella sunshinyii]AJQ94639.1 putative threonine efflux protein [Gynuella sunshinyii YC6258]